MSTNIMNLLSAMALSHGAHLVGPEFTGPATDLSQHTGVGTISLLEVYPGSGSPNVQTLAPALGILRNYFSKSALVMLYLDARLVPPAVIMQAQAQAGVAVHLGGPAQAQTIQTQIQADAQKQQTKRWKILQETQSKIFEIQQNITVSHAKTQDKLYDKMLEYERG